MNEVLDSIIRAAVRFHSDAYPICREIEYRLDVCRATIGTHIEMYWAHKDSSVGIATRRWAGRSEF
jgi:hypothetical protein